jgi:hypothetical protein
MTLGPLIFDSNVLTVDVAGFAEPASKGGAEVGVPVGLTDVEEANHRLGWRLRARR